MDHVECPLERIALRVCRTHLPQLKGEGLLIGAVTQASNEKQHQFYAPIVADLVLVRSTIACNLALGPTSHRSIDSVLVSHLRNLPLSWSDKAGIPPQHQITHLARHFHLLDYLLVEGIGGLTGSFLCWTQLLPIPQTQGLQFCPCPHCLLIFTTQQLVTRLVQVHAGQLAEHVEQEAFQIGLTNQASLVPPWTGQRISAQALAKLFDLFKDQLNARHAYSQAQQALKMHGELHRQVKCHGPQPRRNRPTTRDATRRTAPL